MTEEQALSRMIAPGTPRPGKYRQGVIQIWTTNVCNLSCFGCTQAGNLRGKPRFITPEQFEKAVWSLAGYWGVVGVFGANPAIHPEFEGLCEILCKYIPKEQRGLWCNHPMGKGAAMRRTFNPHVSNLNCHLDREAYDQFRRDWPESMPFGLHEDSRHSPPFVAMKDVLHKPCPGCDGSGTVDIGLLTMGSATEGMPWKEAEDLCRATTRPCKNCNGTGRVYDEAEAWSLISRCPINRHWSAMIAPFRGEVRAWFCEIAAAQSILYQDDPDYPDTGRRVDALYDDGEKAWWELPMHSFAGQVKKHCHDCGIPLQGYGELAQAGDGVEQVSQTHADIYKPKRKGRRVELVMAREQLQEGRIACMTKYIQNAKL